VIVDAVVASSNQSINQSINQSVLVLINNWSISLIFTEWRHRTTEQRTAVVTINWRQHWARGAVFTGWCSTTTSTVSQRHVICEYVGHVYVLRISHAFSEVPEIRFRLAGYSDRFTIRFRFRIRPKCWTASDIATGYSTVSITAAERECHEICLASNHL